MYQVVLHFCQAGVLCCSSETLCTSPHLCIEASDSLERDGRLIGSARSLFAAFLSTSIVVCPISHAGEMATRGDRGGQAPLKRDRSGIVVKEETENVTTSASAAGSRSLETSPAKAEPVKRPAPSPHAASMKGESCEAFSEG